MMKIRSDKNNQMNHNDSVGKVTGFFLFRNLIDNYNHDKNNEAQRQNIKSYGIRSIILAQLSLALTASCLISRLMNLDFLGFSSLVINIIYVAGGVFVSILLAIYACIFAIMQVRLNRKAVGIIGLILSVISIVLCVILTVFIFI